METGTGMDGHKAYFNTRRVFTIIPHVRRSPRSLHANFQIRVVWFTLILKQERKQIAKNGKPNIRII